MNENLIFAYALVTGVLLGAIFFGGLWWTVRRGVYASHVALWFIGSLLLRTGIVVSGFYFVADGNWRRLLAALLGFVLARFIVMWLTRTPAMSRMTQDTRHAP